MGEIDIYSGVYIINTTYESSLYEVHWNRFVSVLAFIYEIIKHNKLLFRDSNT